MLCADEIWIMKSLSFLCGDCPPLLRCLFIIDILALRPHLNTYKYMRSARCGGRDVTFRISIRLLRLILLSEQWGPIARGREWANICGGSK